MSQYQFLRHTGQNTYCAYTSDVEQIWGPITHKNLKKQAAYMTADN
jgi:hypothetical protein